MKLPGALGSFFAKKENQPTYLSLYLDVHGVAASFWQMNAQAKVKTLASAHLPVIVDSWKDRIDAVDRLLGALEDQSGIADVGSTILGLPPSFLTETGEIKKEVRGEIKALASELELTLAGFVPLHQAIIFKLKSDEGVPPSVILLGINTHTIAVNLYKVGTLVGIREIDKHEQIAATVEHGLKSFTEMEVLPARMMLYGPDEKLLHDVRENLLHHPWTSKANFLHFPKIEIVSFEMIVDAVSLAGASEMKIDVGEDEVDQSPQGKQNNDLGDPTDTQTAVADGTKQPEDSSDPQFQEDSETITAQSHADPMEDEVAEAQEVLNEDFAVTPETVSDANVVMVDAASLGFHKKTEQKTKIPQKVDENTQFAQDEPVTSRISLLKTKTFRMLSQFASRGKFGRKGVLVVVSIILFVLFVSAMYWFLPHASVTILVVPKQVDTTGAVAIDPEISTIASSGNTIPGKLIEQTVSGEKNIAVNGKKNIGDPAKGSVVIYNKSLTSKALKKGTVLTSGSLKFTLDSDVTVASASESIGSITFGKSDASVTAAQIGTQSNLPSGTEFGFLDTSTSIISARNDSALTGGTSKQVTVVSRADQDALIKELSSELTEKAKQDLGSSVSGSDQLIDETIKTKIVEKIFDKEIDQEAASLQGKVTLTLSGIAFSKDDIKKLYLENIRPDLPQGYSIDESSVEVIVSDVDVKKNGSISANIALKAMALPDLDVSGLTKILAGKKLDQAQALMKSMPGIGGMEVDYRLNPTRNRLPINTKNIVIHVSIAK